MNDLELLEKLLHEFQILQETEWEMKEEIKQLQLDLIDHQAKRTRVAKQLIKELQTHYLE